MKESAEVRRLKLVASSHCSDCVAINRFVIVNFLQSIINICLVLPLISSLLIHINSTLVGAGYHFMRPRFYLSEMSRIGIVYTLIGGIDH